jgi:hypothetical protein
MHKGSPYERSCDLDVFKPISGLRRRCTDASVIFMVYVETRRNLGLQGVSTIVTAVIEHDNDILSTRD